MCMTKVTGWVDKKSKKKSNFVGFKLVRTTDNIRPEFRSNTYPHIWKLGINVSTFKKNSGISPTRDNAFFHMFTSCLDAIVGSGFDFGSWEKYSHYIMPVKPIGKLLFGTDNKSLYHTVGARRVRWNGILLRPATKPSTLGTCYDVFRYDPCNKRISLLVSRVNICNLRAYINLTEF